MLCLHNNLILRRFSALFSGPSPFAATLLLIVVAFTTSCATPPKPKPTSKPVSWRDRSLKRARNHNLTTSGLAAVTEDTDNDGTTDLWSYYPSTPDGKPAPGTKKVRVERDIDGDGNIEMWLYYGKDGKVSEEELDLDSDGKVDLVKFFVNDFLDHELYADDYSDRFQVRKYYAPDGSVLRVEHDLDGDEATDSVEEYENGAPVRIKRDTNHDGVLDETEELK